MNKKGHQETEVKFYLDDPAGLEKRLSDSGAQLKRSRTFEYNLRFDTPDRELTQGHRVLRLRKDDTVHLTYKGPSETASGATSRQEIEFTVSDFETAQKFIEALGYEIRVIYEKYRTTYSLGELEIVLDELPFGHFMEIEGPDAASIHAVAEKLGLEWEARLLTSYLALFKNVKKSLGLKFRDLTFANFEGLEITKDMFEVKSRDG
ncbi:MAG: class IV adenylate cyclase [Chloroflexi bacterium]|nr:class IV adenylate cyclase [Chloroflexota bacterium]